MRLYLGSEILVLNSKNKNIAIVVVVEAIIIIITIIIVVVVVIIITTISSEGSCDRCNHPPSFLILSIVIRLIRRLIEIFDSAKSTLVSVSVSCVSKSSSTAAAANLTAKAEGNVCWGVLGQPCSVTVKI